MAMAPRNQPLGGLTVGAGGQMLTPQQVAEQRKVAAALMQQASDTSPVGHWTAALNRGLQGYLGGRDMFKANETESNETARALSAFQNRSGMQQPSPVASALAGGQAPAIPAGADGIRQGLISRGLPEHIADAFILNFQDESGLNPGINEISPTVPGSRGGFGLYQLTGPRREAYEAFAADRGVDPADVDAQLDWLMYELQGPEAKAASSIMSAPDTGTAAAAIVNNFLRPAPEHRTARANRYMGGAGAGVSAAPAAGNVSEIAALLADPWLPESARAVLQAEMNQQMQMQNAAYEAHLQNQDPLRQLQIQREQAELDLLMNPQPVTPDPTAGMQNYNFLIEQGVDPATAQGMAFGGGGVNVNVDTGGNSDAFTEAFDKADAATAIGVVDAASSAQRSLAQITAMEEALTNAPTGAAGMIAQRLGELGINTEGLSDVQAAQAAINALVPAQRPPGSGPMSDADLELFKQSLPRIINTADGNAAIMRTMRAIAEYDIQGGQIMQQMREGLISRNEAFRMLNERADPLASARSAMSGNQDQTPQSGNISVSTLAVLTPLERAQMLEGVSLSDLPDDVLDFLIEEGGM